MTSSTQDYYHQYYAQYYQQTGTSYPANYGQTQPLLTSTTPTTHTSQPSQQAWNQQQGSTTWPQAGQPSTTWPQTVQPTTTWSQTSMTLSQTGQPTVTWSQAGPSTTWSQTGQPNTTWSQAGQPNMVWSGHPNATWYQTSQQAWPPQQPAQWWAPANDGSGGGYRWTGTTWEWVPGQTAWAGSHQPPAAVATEASSEIPGTPPRNTPHTPPTHLHPPANDKGTPSHSAEPATLLVGKHGRPETSDDELTGVKKLCAENSSIMDNSKGK